MLGKSVREMPDTSPWIMSAMEHFGRDPLGWRGDQVDRVVI